MLPSNYTRAVLAHYHQKLAANELSLNIRQLSPASFKEACLEVRRKRFSKKDGLPLMAYFEEGSDQDACLLAIASQEIDTFRPLVNFIKGKTKNPDDKVVELVAWLIDFQDRPYDPRKPYSVHPDTPQGPLIDIAIDVPPVESVENENGPLPISTGTIENKPEPNLYGATKDRPQSTSLEAGREKKKRKKIIVVITISIAFGMIAYWAWPNKPTAPGGSQSCMYWAGDHYQPVDCRKRIQNVQVIALDTEMLNHFKKINQPDTITANAVGHVWYVKYRGNYEYYTADGFHPIDPQLRLRPISEGTIRRHVPATQ